MLERTAGCLETGSLRRLVPGSQKPLKSRRMLHSAFWNHGATELEYSPLWAALIRGLGTAVNEHEEMHSKSVSNAYAGGFLDFLYPSGAVRFIRQYSLWKPDTQDAQRARAGFGRLGQRLYTSVAVEASPRPVEKVIDLPEVEIKEDNHTFPAKCEPSPDSRCPKSKHSNSFLKYFKGLQSTQDYDKVWRQFTMVDMKDRRLFISPLLAYLSTSNRPLDAERAASVFEEIRTTAGHDEYGSLIKLYLNRGMFQSAMEFYHEGLTKFDVPVGSDMLLAHALEKCHWQRACDIWITFKRFRQERPSLSYNIWLPSDELPSLPDRAIQLAEFVKDELDKASGMRHSLDSTIFASFLTARALLAMSGAKTLEPFKFNALLKVLHQWDADTSERYEQIIERLLESGHTKFAIQCYRKYRQHNTKKISRPILDKVLNVACKHYSILGMQQVLDDWVRFYSRPSGHAYRLCMSAFATQGDVDTVTTLFDQYVKSRGGNETIENADDIAPLLDVHARRGELSDVVKIFDGIEEKYGVQPSIKCWNILINAHGKVLDIDGAFTQFQRLLNSSLQPDSYTYGTLMGICTTRGDLDQAMELYQLAEGQGVAKSAAMIDCLVLGHIQDDRLEQAEKICNDALAMDFKAPLSRMWNYLLTAYAMRRDLGNTNRILRRMYDAGVDYDGATYSALMQVLAMVKQPDRANDILNNVMREAGVKVTSFHYAVVMGGYIANGELHKVFRVHNQMLRRNMQQTISTRLMTLKASVLEDQRTSESGSQEEQWRKAKQYFYDAYIAPDAQEMVDNMRKGSGYEPLDIAYQSSYFGYLIFVLGQRNSLYRATELYERYIDSIPEHRRGELPLKILSALMVVSLRNKDYESVQQLWELAFKKAKKQGQPFQVPQPPEGRKILPLHKQVLTIPLSIQMRSLARQQKIDQLYRTKDEVENAGFVLDNKNWNIYIQCLARSNRYKQAFDLCELRLMNGWTGWARIRWKEPERNRLPHAIRHMRKNKKPIVLRPFYGTFLQLGKAYMDLQDEVAESQSARDIQDYLERRCSRTLHALRTMERVDDDLEREILRES
jgi:pentatricopeptide repeat-containing protein PET309